MGFVIKYEGCELDNGIDIKELGESLIGFSELNSKVFGIGDLSEAPVKVTNISQGSIIVDIAFSFFDYKELFSNNIELALNFIKNTNHDLYVDIQNSLLELGSDTSLVWNKIEEYGREKPVSTGLGIAVGTPLIPKLIGSLYSTLILTIKGFNIKEKDLSNIGNDEQINVGNGIKIDINTAKRIKNIVTNANSEKFLEPLINETSNSIKICYNGKVEEITSADLHYFIGKGKEILPEFIDGNIYEMKGQITAMQSNRGETLTFSTKGGINLHLDKNYLFCCIVGEGKSIEEYKEYYGHSKNLVVKLKAIRPDIYKKPKFKIIEIKNLQQQLIVDDLD